MNAYQKLDRKYGFDELRSFPTLCVGQADDLKVEGPGFRVWLSRVEAKKVSVERFRNGRWETTEEYQTR